MVLLALEHCQASRPEQQSAVEARALVWLKGMQSQDGGFAAFDADNDWCVLNSIPFSDHNAMLDPTCPDITGRVLEALCRRGLPSSDPAVHGAVNFLLKTQEQDGSWYGRWGVNYLYGTFLALRGLRAAGSPDRNVFRRAADFVQANQNADGGWGESCLSYEVNRFVPAPSTPSQTLAHRVTDRGWECVVQGCCVHGCSSRQVTDRSSTPLAGQAAVCTSYSDSHSAFAPLRIV